VRHMYLIMLGSILLTGCSSEDVDVDVNEDDCYGVDLPECPEECPVDYAATCGEPCEIEYDECGNNIGDGRICLDGIWQCTVHAPLGGPGVCNLVCL
jgi:hypothetical protein